MNRCKLAQDALFSVVGQVFADVAPERNPGGYREPAAKGPDGLAPYLAQIDDKSPETLSVMTGPIYELKLLPQVVLAFGGKALADREAEAWRRTEALRAALAEDPRLNGLVDWADCAAVLDIDPGDNPANRWMAGGLVVEVRLLLTAPSAIG